MASAVTNQETTSILLLSDEILVEIFCLIPDPQHFTASCSRIYKISQDPWTRSKYFMQYGKSNAFHQALSKGHLLTPRCIDIMISSGARLSRYLIQSVVGHYTKGNVVKHIRGNWCRSMKYTSFAHFVSIGATRYGDDIDILKGGGDAAIVEAYITAKSNPGTLSPESLDERWLIVREIFEKHQFMPFDEKDPAMKMFPQWVSVEPRLLPLARRNGFGMLDDWREVMLKRIFTTSMSTHRPPSPDAEASTLAKLVLELTELDPAIFVSRSLAGSICLDKLRVPHGYAALKILNSANGLRFELSSLVTDLLGLFSNSFLLYSKEMVDIVHSLYKDMRSPADPALRPIIILSIFARTTPALDAHIPFDCTMTERIRILDARNAAINKITEQLDDLGLFPLTKLDLMSVLESRITRTARPVLAYILKNQHTLEITDTDVHAIAENTAVAALTCSSKGSMLKDLVATHPDLVQPIRVAIQKYDVDVEDLVYSNSRMEPPIWASLGTPPEHPRDDFARSERTNHDLGDLSMTPAVLPHGYFAAQQQIDSLLANLDSSFSVSDWVLDKFGARSREAAIFFTHSLLACVNGDTRYFMKFLNRGVPVTFMHFQMRFKLEQDIPEQLWRVIEYQSFYATYEHYMSRSQCWTKAPSNDKQIGVRPAKRPRRQAAQAVKTYAITPGTIESSSTPSGIDLDDDPFEYDSTHGSSIGGGVDAIYDGSADDLHRADQLALWIKNLADILHEEARKLRARKKVVGRDGRGKPHRMSKTPAHIELLKRLPPLRRLEADLRGSVISALDPELVESEAFGDDAKDADWEDPRKKRKRRTELYT